MDRKYYVPVGSMFAGLGGWIAFLVWQGATDADPGPWLEVGAPLVAGGLVLLSAFR